MSGEVILKAENLVKYYPIKAGVLRRTVGQVKAVDGVSFELLQGRDARHRRRVRLRQVHPRPHADAAGGADGAASSPSTGSTCTPRRARAMRRLRRDIQIVFQDPYTSLNPRKTVGDIVGEPFEIHPDVVPKGGRRKRVQELLDLVGLNPEHINRYPHQFSGGQRQRIGIARGIALNPKVIICDEPVSALDVSVQAQVVNLLEKLQDELGLAYIFIAHDLSVVRHISDRVGVMYLGKMAELGDEDQIYVRPDPPVHPGAAVGRAGARPDAAQQAGADRAHRRCAQPGQPAVGCRFHTRCWKAQDICSIDEPLLIERPDGASAHLSACHFAELRVIL